MNAVTTIDEDAPMAEDTVPEKKPDLALNMVHGFLRHILQSLDAESRRWQRQLACTPRGADFDLRDMGDGATKLDKLAIGGDALGEALARGDAPTEVGQSVLAHLAEPLAALSEFSQAARTDARQQVFLKRYAAVFERLDDDMQSVGRGMRDLSNIAARGAASLDPDATLRTLSRLRQLGDSTMRLIEDRIVSAETRDEGKRLRALRDDMKIWIEDRNARLEQMQSAADELNIRSNALRNGCLMQAKRLAAAATLTEQASSSFAGGIGQTSPEAMVLSALLRALLLESRTDITAPLHE
jgi:hypothetical protein